MDKSNWFKDMMNQEEIMNITDLDVRNIRMKYWNLKFKAFKDEYNIPDQELGNVLDKICNAEQEELKLYKEKYGVK